MTMYHSFATALLHIHDAADYVELAVSFLIGGGCGWLLHRLNRVTN